jgi:hypothetical protein
MVIIDNQKELSMYGLIENLSVENGFIRSSRNTRIEIDGFSRLCKVKIKNQSAGHRLKTCINFQNAGIFRDCILY